MTNKCVFYCSVIVNIAEVASDYIEAKDMLSMDEILLLECVHTLINVIFTLYFGQSVVLKLTVTKKTTNT